MWVSRRNIWVHTNIIVFVCASTRLYMRVCVYVCLFGSNKTITLTRRLRKQKVEDYLYIHTYIPLTLYPRRGSSGISDIPPRCPRFTKITQLGGILQT
jgi:hypothetical protein